jgi:hypothetical protein
MNVRRTLVTASCAAALIVPTGLTAQQRDTTRRDTTRMQDTTRRTTQDSTRRGMRDSTRRDTTGMRGMNMNRMQDTARMRRDSAAARTNRAAPAATPRATSDQRLPVQKRGEAAGTLDLRADSIAAAEKARSDSMAMAAAEARTRDSLAVIERARTDSIAAVERRRADSLAVIERARADSVARADSIAREIEARRQYMSRYRFGGNGWYLGVSGGASAPTGDFQDLGYNSGFDVNVPIGWQKPNSFLGARLDLGYSRFRGENFLGQGTNAVTLVNANPQVYSATLNLTAALPLNFIRNVSFYGVGGAGLYHFRNMGTASALGGFLGNDVLNTNEANNKTSLSKIGAQIGAGLDWTVGTSSIFLESRFVNVFADRDDNVQFRDFFGDNRSNTLKWVPIVVGVKIR